MTDQPLTPDELDAIEKRCNAATHGPWVWVPRWACATSSFLRLDNFEAADVIAVETECVSEGDHRTTLVVDQDDADFIAASRTDVPRLLAEVKRLRAWLEWFRSQVDPESEVEVWHDDELAVHLDAALSGEQPPKKQP